MSKIQMPIDAVVAITYRCNSRCVMCDIWKIQGFPEIFPQEYLKLPSTLNDLNVSGGEPFLRNDLPEIIKSAKIACPKARIVISTNGLEPQMIENQMKEILKIDSKIGVAISLDGIGGMHEAVRRIPNAYNKCIETLERLKKLGMKNLRFAFTIVPQNVSHFGKVYDEARKYGIQFTHAFAQSSENYFGGIHFENHPDAKELRKQYEYVIEQELKSWNLKRWARAYFAYTLYKFIAEKRQALNSDPGTKFFFMDPAGTVYPSVVHNFPMGNICEVKNWQGLWYGSKADSAREKVRSEGIPAWMICTARTAIKKRPFKVGWWILKNKFFAVHL